MTLYTPKADELPRLAQTLVRRAQAAQWRVRLVATDDGSGRILVSLRQDDRHLIGLWHLGSFYKGYVSASVAQGFGRLLLKDLNAELARDPRREYVEAMQLISATMGATQPWEAVQS
jgi:hypothetical protein